MDDYSHFGRRQIMFLCKTQGTVLCATVAVAVASIYNPAIAAYIAKLIATIRKSIRIAATTLVPIMPNIVGALG